jgi:Zn-dependent peptidase ImmA (M78 family)
VTAVNTFQHTNRQRFTIAHELAHYFLQKGLEEHVDQNFRIAWRNADSSKAINWIGIEANRFASALLTPEEFLRSDLDALQKIGKRTAAASRYGVSPEDMKFG